MGDRICAIEDCDGPSQVRGWCRKHWQRWWKHGDPTAAAYIVGDHEARFWSKVQKDGPVPAEAPSLGPCWVWVGYRGRTGYGRFTVDGKAHLAYRWAYERFVALVPPGLELDHLCRNRACVRAEHLEPVTHRVNSLRGDTIAARNAAKTHCPSGHAYDEANTKVTYHRDRTARRCRACARYAARRERRRVQSQS